MEYYASRYFILVPWVCQFGLVGMGSFVKYRRAILGGGGSAKYGIWWIRTMFLLGRQLENHGGSYSQCDPTGQVRR